MAKEKIQVGLRSVKELSFKYNPEKLGKDFDPNLLRLGFDNSLEALEGDKDWITIDFGVKYFYKDEEVLECIYGFNFVVGNLTKYVKMNPDKSVKIDEIMPRLLTIALGTLRGIIIAKTSGTPLYECPLPVIDIEDSDK